MENTVKNTMVDLVFAFDCSKELVGAIESAKKDLLREIERVRKGFEKKKNSHYDIRIKFITYTDTIVESKFFNYEEEAEEINAYLNAVAVGEGKCIGLDAMYSMITTDFKPEKDTRNFMFFVSSKDDTESTHTVSDFAKVWNGEEKSNLNGTYNLLFMFAPDNSKYIEIYQTLPKTYIYIMNEIEKYTDYIKLYALGFRKMFDEIEYAL